MPIIGTGWIGAGLLLMFMPRSVYLVDSFRIYAASTLTPNTVMSSFVGVFLPVPSPMMHSALGLQWGNSLLARIVILL
jgi:hypothetical protein